MQATTGRSKFCDPQSDHCSVDVFTYIFTYTYVPVSLTNPICALPIEFLTPVFASTCTVLPCIDSADVAAPYVLIEIALACDMMSGKLNAGTSPMHCPTYGQ